MVVIQRSKYGLKIAEVYFADSPQLPSLRTDIAMYVRCRARGRGLSEAKTLVIDLTADEDAIFSQCSRTTRKNIKRSDREGLNVEFVGDPSLAQLEEFCTFYRNFAEKKKRPQVAKSRLFELHRLGALTLSYVRDREGAELVFHLYVVDRDIGRAMQLYGASHFRDYDDSADRNVIARAHRYLCWMNIVSFKKLGFRIYDFGGLPPDDADEELQQIAFFKKGFGGRQVVEYSGHIGLTILGKIACALR